ncbi:glutathione S-transferase [Mycena belliarum]|uniref:glutathione transferase n=1 Tax=Mycena belliarum TaxID=1033014 RepID=A0AAD6XNX3_9AGAR|nr:glutathione S-transferase [Mycena belliae]
MVLKLYGDNSPVGGSGIVAMVLLEKKIPFELIHIDLSKGENKTPEYLALHQFGLVPIIDDNGFILHEARAICRYLEEKYAGQGTRFIPTELRDKARFEEGASVELTEFFPRLRRLAVELGFNPQQKASTDEAALPEAKAALAKTLSEYEWILSQQKYIGGDELTLADIFHLYSVPPLKRAGFDVIALLADKCPNVKRWYNDLVSRSSWVKLQEGIQSVAMY